MIDMKTLSDKQLNELNAKIRREVERRYKAKHLVNGEFQFEGKPMRKAQAIQAFLDAKVNREKNMDKVLEDMPQDVKMQLIGLGELRQYAVRTKNEEGAKKLHTLMVEKMGETNMQHKAEEIIERFYS